MVSSLIQGLTRSRQRLIFVFGILAIYTAIFVGFNYLQGPYWWDEKQFWQTSLTFSERLIPTLDQLRNYSELNTPLPFIIYGMLEHLFQGGIFVGRLLNFGLSIAIAFIIGWPSKNRGIRAILCLIGLFLCPYYLWLSSKLYTDIIAAFFSLAGFWFYVRNRHIASGLAFILGIASRQYMLAFPVAIAAHEISQSLLNRQKVSAKQLLSWIVPLGAALSIVGWFYLFQGLAPSAAFDARPAPEVQRALWDLNINTGLYFLSFVGLYFVIPEFILFGRSSQFVLSKENRRKYIIIAAILLLAFIIFPPTLKASGNLVKIANLLPAYGLKVGLFYLLALMACIRFSQLDLAFWILLFNCLIMTKAYPWDRYVLPLMIVFWYLKSIGYLHKSGAESEMPNKKLPGNSFSS